MSALMYGESIGGAEQFWIRFRNSAREPQSWKDELFAAARAVKSKTTKPLWICASGGIDSDVVCRAFYEQGLHFSVLTFSYGPSNAADVRFIGEWCAVRHVPHDIVPLDPHVFFAQDIPRLSRDYGAIHPFRYLQLRLLEEVERRGGYGVLGSDDQLYRVSKRVVDISPQDVYLSLSTGTVTPFRWCSDHGTEHEPYFQFATPELVLAYHRHPLNRFALEHPELVYPHRTNTHLLKKIIYQATWPDLAPRVTSDGFAGVRGEFEAARTELRARFLGAHREVRLPAIELEAQLAPLAQNV
jgi:hypothetical protein